MAGLAMTYRELNSRANRLADQLCQQGVGPEVPVGLVCGRGFEAIVGMLAVLKADGICVPFDATMPAERLRVMSGLAGLRLVITTEAMQCARPGLGGPVAIVRIAGECPAAPNLQPRIRPADTAHLFFTTGSTGRPRAVPVSHAAADNLIHWQQLALPFRPGMRVLQFSPPGMDSAWQEIAGTLCAGGVLVIPAAEERSHVDKLCAFIAASRIERAFLPAATLAHLAGCQAAPLEGLRDLVVTCGPVLITDEIRAFFTVHRSCRLHAHYGHAETLVALACTIEGTPAAWPGILPLGRPIHGISARVLGDKGQPVNAGELWIGGPHLPRAYHRDPASSRERFRMDPAAAEGNSAARIFRTGDRVRETAQGYFELAGGSTPSRSNRKRPQKPGKNTIPASAPEADAPAQAVA
ncbi:MAG: AMP-binding protein [Opitutaceae bacterium]